MEGLKFVGEILGINNNNYLNIKDNPNNRWAGSIGIDIKGHAIFRHPVYCFRAATKIMWEKQKSGKNTILSLIKSFAPEEDGNDPVEYAANVALRLGISEDMPLNLFDSDGRVMRPQLLVELFDAMMVQELMAGWICDQYVVLSGIAYYVRDFVK